MARFMRPAGASLERYKVQGGELVALRLTENKRATVLLDGGIGLEITSRNSTVLRDDQMRLSQSLGGAGVVAAELYGRAGGKAIVEARLPGGMVAASIDVTVVEINRGSSAPAWIRLDGPHASLNAPNVPKMQMSSTRVVPWAEGAEEMLKKVPRGSRHLVFNCHGFRAGKKEDFPAAHLSIGTAIHLGNVGAFSQLRELHELKVIWLQSCNIAGAGEGNELCQRMADASGCYVVAQEKSIPMIAAPANHVYDAASQTPLYFKAQSGEKIWRGDFFALDRELGFELKRK